MIPAEPMAARGAGRDTGGLLFAAEMYGVQLDHLAAVLGVSEARARGVAARWRGQGYADSARLAPGGPWTWLTGPGLAACGLRYTASRPALGRLAHIRAVVAVRLALESAHWYTDGAGYWRSERRLRSRMGGRVGLRQHVPDGEVHWPDDTGVPWAGECWAIEAELTPKTTSRTVTIMRELLARTGDYGCAAAEVATGGAPRHARVVYVCTAAAQPTVAKARQALGSAAERVEIRLLPAGAALPAPGRRRASAPHQPALGQPRAAP
jgi:hypothetical protein